MCGIIGIAGASTVTERLLTALKKLEYRGYDSAGIATFNDKSELQRCRAVGKLAALEKALTAAPLDGPLGIGHTRWATHGKPTEENAHPHMTDRVAIVHNGIIENYSEIRDDLLARGVTFKGESDTEVICHLLDRMLAETPTIETAIQAFLDQLHGAFALAILIKDQPDTLYCARQGSPLVIGLGSGMGSSLGSGENYIGSDAIALADLTQQVIYLEEGDWAAVTAKNFQIFDRTHTPVQRPITSSYNTGALVNKGNYAHFMLKEIHEQPTVVAQTLGRYINYAARRLDLPDMPFDLQAIPRITLIACGTSFYAAMVAKYWFEQIAGIPVDVDIASEFRYRSAVMTDGGLTVLISQSGETADTLAALRHAKERGQKILSILNVAGSSMARESDAVLQTYAGPEIGVASTKAFTCQLAVLACLVLATARAREALSDTAISDYIHDLEMVPALMAAALNKDQSLKATSRQLSKAKDVLFLGRGIDFPIAMEGALKLKEISYIHAEGYAAGEMKHGPIALIDESVPIIVLAPTGPLYAKTISNMQEVLARGGKVILISDKAGLETIKDDTIATIEMPTATAFTGPLIYSIPVQLLAYYTAVVKGTDVDQPRNLAKSVTVE